MTKRSDEWQTPAWLFEELNKEFNFDIDLCATAENSKCDSYCENYLIQNIKGCRSAFMNPPYSNPKPFIEKAWEDSKHCKIVCLVKCDPSTRWWSTFWLYSSIFGYLDNNGPKPGCTVRFFPKRIKFIPPPEAYNKKCVMCDGEGSYIPYDKTELEECYFCGGKRIYYDKLQGRNGPTFPCALIIFDRRGL